MHQITIEPWTHYDDQLRAWWPVNVVGPCGKFSLAWTSADGGRWAESNELRRLKNRNGRLLHCAEDQVRAALTGVTEKSSSVTESGAIVTDQERDTLARGRERAKALMSRLSRVTDNAVTVTDQRDSDSHYPSVHDRHGHPVDCSENLIRRRAMVAGETYCASCDRCGEPFQLCDCGKSVDQLAAERGRRLQFWRRVGFVVIAFWALVGWAIWGHA